MKLNKPHTLEDALNQATLFVEIEEEKATLIKKHTVVKLQISKDKAREEYYEPQQHLDDGYLMNVKEK